ncbi:MAG: hypothetical protein ACOYK8_01520 [Alphaproteobacteria bacterium]
MIKPIWQGADAVIYELAAEQSEEQLPRPQHFIYRSLSHAGGKKWVAYGRVPLGLDVVAPTLPDNLLEIVAIYFPPDLQKIFHATPTALQPWRFLQLWAHIEASGKLAGTGITEQ